MYPTVVVYQAMIYLNYCSMQDYSKYIHYNKLSYSLNAEITYMLTRFVIYDRKVHRKTQQNM